MTCRTTQRPSRGFTLIELLVVIAIVGLLTVAALPTVVAALGEREILDASSLLQTALLTSRDAAARNGNASGIRLLLNSEISHDQAGNLRYVDANGNSVRNPGEPLSTIAADRFVQITQAPDYSSGTVRVGEYSTIVGSVIGPVAVQQIVIYENKFLVSMATFPPTLLTQPISPNYQPTDWYRNIRQGETIRLNQSSRAYRIAGPINGAGTGVERQLNIDGVSPVVSLPQLPAAYPAGIAAPTIPMATPSPPLVYINYCGAEYMFVTNGIDDDGDGVIDEQCDGIDNNNDGLIDPAYDGIDNDGVGGVDNIEELFWVATGPNPGQGYYHPLQAEYEAETLDSTTRSRMDAMLAGTSFRDGMTYSIQRRAVVAPGAKEVMLPSTIVVDLTTTAFAAPERSRLPFDPVSGTVDILFEPNGRVQEETIGSNVQMLDRNLPYYHFWLASKDDVFAPSATAPVNFPFLPIPPDPSAAGISALNNVPRLKRQRRLVTLFTKTGNVVINGAETCTRPDPTTGLPYWSAEAPYLDAQAGTREP